MSEKPGEIKSEGRRVDRRRFVRVEQSSVVYYTDVSSKNPKSDSSYSKNISAGGILFITGKKFLKGTILKLRLRIPGAVDYVNVHVEVVNSKELVKGVMYDTRARFLNIKKEDKDAIWKIVAERLRKKKV